MTARNVQVTGGGTLFRLDTRQDPTRLRRRLPTLDEEAEPVAICSELCKLVRWLLRRPESPPPPDTGQRYQATEQAAAQRRLLDEAERLRRRQWYCEPTQMAPNVPMTLGQHTGHGTRGHG